MSKKPTRMEQLGALLTAMVYVVVSGSSGLTLNPDSESQTSKARDSRSCGLLVVPPDILRGFLPGGKYRGMVSRLALQLEVTQLSIRAVLHGRQRSERIASALLAEIALIDGTEIASESITSSDNRFQPFTKAQIVEFKSGGRYRGLQQRVAKNLGINDGSISCIVHGKTYSSRVAEALKAEIRKIDGPDVLFPIAPKSVLIKRRKPDNGSKPFTSEEIEALSKPPYRGVSKKIAKQLGMHPQNVSHVVRGKRRSDEVICEIRREMRRIDKGGKA
jgi:hypothetical protein